MSARRARTPPLPAASRGDRAAQRELFHRLAPRVHEALYHALGSNHRMEEHIENAFVEIFRSLPDYDPDLDLNTWACRIAVRTARDDVDDASAAFTLPVRGYARAF